MIFTEKFCKSEIIDGVYISAELKQIWAVNLDLLYVFEKFCKEHGIKFFIGFGTLLGAFRHQGFVPWDDDVDILMFREDFERLKLLWQEFSYPYFLQNELSEPGFWYRGMMKFRRSDTTCLTEHCYQKWDMNQSIALEIMPLDEVSDVAMVRRQQEHEVGHWQRLLWAKHYSAGFYHRDRLAAERHDGEFAKWRQEAEVYEDKYLHGKYLQACQSFMHGDGTQLALFIGYQEHDGYRLLQKKWFADTVSMDFGGLTLPAPAGFWECLEFFYGKGFVSFVPSCERKAHHAALWDVDTPYDVWQRRLLDYDKWAGKQVVLFGTGSMAEAFWQKHKDILPSGTFCVDNNEKMVGELFHGMPVKAVAELIDMDSKYLHIVICNGYYREIGKQLKTMGIEQYYVWVDDSGALFQLIGSKNSMKQVNKEYHIAGIYVKQRVLTDELLGKIRQAKERCEYLLAFVEKENHEMQNILKAIEFVNRVVLAKKNDIKLEEYFCEEMWEL
ncbi:MAG: LicD family protein [Butyrivibrio sp.]|nr:LicD family protein [Butyrivibrio sp.]